MTRQAWTALAAAVAFVLCATAVLLVPVPFVAWSPGRTADTLGEVDGKPLIVVDGLPSYPTSGRLDLTTVLQTSAGSRLTLPEAVWSYVAPHRDVLPRASIYDSRVSPEQAAQEEVLQMQTSQSVAVVAALRAADQPVTTYPAVSAVTVGGQSFQKLQPGDLIKTVDGAEPDGIDGVGALIGAKPAGSVITFEVLRDKKPVTVEVTSRKATTAEDRPKIDITVGPGYLYEPKITFDLGDRIGGPSAGLAFSLAIYDKITPGALLDGRHVAGTGTITAAGQVGPIGGIQEKIAGAQDAGATVFFVPAGNCDDLAGVSTDLNLIKAETLAGAIAALRDLDAGGARAAGVPRC